MTDDPYGVAALYDLEYANHDEDIRWYVRCARAAPGPILELGCGTGRLTLPMARAGVLVTGVDRAPNMLAGLREKLAGEAPTVADRVRVLEGDYQTVMPGSGFGAVLWPFNAMHHLDGADAVVSVLERIRGWIAPGGSLAMDCYLPDRGLYDRDPDERYEFRLLTDPRSGQVLNSWEQGWWDEARRLHHVLYTYEHLDGSREQSHLVLRMYEIDEIRTIVARAGWQLVHEAQDFEGQALGSDALKWVALLRP